MTTLTQYGSRLPETINDIASFLLVAPEKAKAVKAEIQAIKNLRLAQEVYDQKLDEQRRLAELILDASVKIGEFSKKLPKASGERTDLRPNDSGVARLSKSEAVRELGFSPKQVERFETLADNADLVEQVKAEARETGTVPTRTKVLDLAIERKRREEVYLKTDLAQIDNDYDNWILFGKAVEFADLYKIDESVLRSVVALETDEEFARTLDGLSKMTTLLTILREKLIMLRSKKNGQT